MKERPTLGETKKRVLLKLKSGKGKPLESAKGFYNNNFTKRRNNAVQLMFLEQMQARERETERESKRKVEIERFKKNRTFFARGLVSKMNERRTCFVFVHII